MILFLDFDGVLHTAFNASSPKDDFKKLPLLEKWLRRHPEVNIVISSSWREVMSMASLKEIFSEDLRNRVIDTCSILPLSLELEFYRYEEIMSWIKLQKYDGIWLALDDATHEFPPNFEKLVVCQKHRGIDRSVIRELTIKLMGFKSSALNSSK